jgi:DnaJ-class molecular chaperone
MVDPRREKPDYYQILGIGSSATSQEIDRAYRRLASRYHPDVSRETADSTEKFKSIAQAYEVLGDPGRRRDYDAAERRQNQGMRRPASSFSGIAPAVTPRPQRSFASDWMADIFRELAEWQGSAAAYGAAKPPAAGTGSELDIEADLPLTPEEAARGVPCEFTLSLRQACPECEGRRQAADVACGTCQGTGTVSGPRQSVRVMLPPGVEDGVVVRLFGGGRRRLGPGAAGDLCLKIRIRPCW